MKQQVCFTQYLNAKEITNPFTVIDDFLKLFDLQQAKKYIARWMVTVHEDKVWNIDSPDMLLLFYEKTLKLIEGTWLINKLDNSNRLANLSKA